MTFGSRDIGDTCRKCGGPRGMVSCPDGLEGCCVAHFGCLRSCEAVRAREEAQQREALEALQEANGIK